MRLVKNRTLAFSLILLGWLVFFAGLVWAAPNHLASASASLPAASHGASAGVSWTTVVSDTTYLPLVANQFPGVVIVPIGSVTPPPSGANWLAYVNYYRALAGLPALPEDMTLSDGDKKHAHYMVGTNNSTSYESMLYPTYYTPEGDQAARKSNLFASSSPGIPDDQAIAAWMQGPFHALGILDPALQRTGFGSDHDSAGWIQSAAALDIISGLDENRIPANIFPVAWPGNGATVYLRTYSFGADSPEPLTSCPSNYPTTTGLPIILQIGSGSLATVDVTASSLKRGSTVLDNCLFTENTYTNPDSSLQATGRAILGARDAIVLVPKDPLLAGADYTVSVKANGLTYTWSFKAAP
jgi:uncharacterized protein YkwD